MITYGWALAAASVLIGVIALVRRPPGRDVVIIVSGVIGLAAWNLGAAYYLDRPLPYRCSALYLVGVSLSVTSWLMLARRMVYRTWWPGPRTMAVLLSQPILLTLSGVLPERVWSDLFWPRQPWRDEPLGIGYDVHSAWMMVLIAIGAAAMIRRSEHTQGLDRILAAGAVLAVSVGIGAQLAGVRIMSTTAVLAFALLIAAYVRLNPSTVSALAELGERDPVTGALDRSGLDAVLRRAVADARADGSPLSAMMIDIDDFKGVNDRHGHVVGDIALRQVVTQAASATGGIIGRFGGDEFVVVLPGIDVVAAHRLARDVVEQASQPFEAAGQEPAVTVSVGVAEYDGTSVDDLLVAADRAMYAAKRRGGGRSRYPRRSQG